MKREIVLPLKNMLYNADVSISNITVLDLCSSLCIFPLIHSGLAPDYMSECALAECYPLLLEFLPVNAVTVVATSSLTIVIKSSI